MSQLKIPSQSKSVVKNDNTDLVIVGTMALDSVETPFGSVENAMGGSATYSALAASYFTKPGVVSIVGQDFPSDYIQLLKLYKINLDGVERLGKTFRWSGSYEFDMSQAKTKQTDLNSLIKFQPKLPEKYKKAKYIFLANFDPALQMQVLDQIRHRVFVLLDTMNYWIETKRSELLGVIARVNMLVINDGEARQLCGTTNLIKAGRAMLGMGPEYVIIKKGEHGALLFSHRSHFSAPAYPLEDVRDPTGAGDSFAGGLIGYLASVGDVTETSIRRGVIYGSAIASYSAEDFSVKYRSLVSMTDIETRYKTFEQVMKF